MNRDLSHYRYQIRQWVIESEKPNETIIMIGTWLIDQRQSRHHLATLYNLSRQYFLTLFLITLQARERCWQIAFSCIIHLTIKLQALYRLIAIVGNGQIKQSINKNNKNKKFANNRYKVKTSKILFAHVYDS